MNPVKVDLICRCGSPVTIYYLDHVIQVITVGCKCGETLTWRSDCDFWTLLTMPDKM